MKKAKAWRAATDIKITGVTVEQRPLSPKTLKRIAAGLYKFFGKTISSREIKGIAKGLKKRGGRR